MKEEKYKGASWRRGYMQGYKEAISNLKIGELRQWINEKPFSQIVHDKDIKIMLGIERNQG